MNQPSNSPGGRYVERDDRGRPSYPRYQKDDEPQIVASGVINNVVGQPVVVEQAYNVRLVENAGLSLRVHFQDSQRNAVYHVQFTEEFLPGLVPRHWVAHLRLGDQFRISAYSEAGVQLNLGQNTRRIAFIVRRGII